MWMLDISGLCIKGVVRAAKSCRSFHAQENIEPFILLFCSMLFIMIIGVKKPLPK